MASEIEILREENKRLKTIVDALMFGYNTICEANLKTGVVSFFKLARDFMPAPGLGDKMPLYDDLVAAYIKYGIDEEDRDKARVMFDRKYLTEQLSVGECVTGEYRNEKGVFGVSKVVKISDDTVLVGFTEQDREINERREQLYSDSLTGVKNRKYYDEYLSTKICMALVIADVDRFKSINDTFGHLCGDDVLALVAATLKASVRDTDEVVRYGGDEFLLVFRNITMDLLEKRMEEIRQKVENLRIEKHPDVRISMSFGGVFGTGMVKDLIPMVDDLLYASKKKRNTVTIKKI